MVWKMCKWRGSQLGLSRGPDPSLSSPAHSPVCSKPGPSAVFLKSPATAEGCAGEGWGSRQAGHTLLAGAQGPAVRPSPKLGTILGGVDPAPTSDGALVLQAAGGVALHLGSGPLTHLQPCRAARCHMPTRPPPSTNLPTRVAWVSSASEKVWHRRHSLASHPHRLKFWADLPMVLASTPRRA